MEYAYELKTKPNLSKRMLAGLINYTLSVRVIEFMGKWIPGILNGEKVIVFFTLPIKFTLRNKK